MHRKLGPDQKRSGYDHWTESACRITGTAANRTTEENPSCKREADGHRRCSDWHPFVRRCRNYGKDQNKGDQCLDQQHLHFAGPIHRRGRAQMCVEVDLISQ